MKSKVKPDGKCFCRFCDDCHWFFDWDMTNKEGLRAVKKRCLFRVLANEIPRIRGSIDGVQGAANEARNRAMETKIRVEEFGEASVKTLENISRKKLN